MAVDMNKIAKLSALDKLADMVSTEINNVKVTATDAIKNVSVNGNTINFYTEKNPETDTAVAFSVDFPAEMFIDQARTEFAQNFSFSATEYEGATNPNLDGKPVLILAVKTKDAHSNETINYSFLDLDYLIHKISKVDGNIIEERNDGLYATTRVSGAVQGNVAIFDANGAPADGGIASDTLVTTSMIATEAEVDSMLDKYFSTGE